jgi:hypothetical protein
MADHQHPGLDSESPNSHQKRRDKKRDGDNSDPELGTNQLTG